MRNTDTIVFIRPEEALRSLGIETLNHIVDAVCWYIAKNEYAHYEEMHDFFKTIHALDDRAEEVLLKIIRLYRYNDEQSDILFSYGYGYGYDGQVFAFDNTGIGVDLI
jgi:hypothetical protein